MRRKHRNDKKHCKGGFVSGNLKYRRHARKPHPHDKSMGKCVCGR